MKGNPHKNPNPQGKGVVPILSDWSDTRPARVNAKAPAELLFDWFASALVLSAEFSFKPVPGQAYFLYAQDERWQLSLVAPEEWRGREVGDCLGRCELRHDMTWSVAADADLANKPALQQRLAALAESFMSDLDRDEELDAVLPGYRRELPYYQRLLATGLGTSLRCSADVDNRPARSARELLGEGEGSFRRLLDLS